MLDVDARLLKEEAWPSDIDDDAAVLVTPRLVIAVISITLYLPLLVFLSSFLVSYFSFSHFLYVLGLDPGMLFPVIS